jgi:hypothetical protein
MGSGSGFGYVGPGSGMWVEVCGYGSGFGYVSLGLGSGVGLSSGL